MVDFSNEFPDLFPLNPIIAGVWGPSAGSAAPWSEVDSDGLRQRFAPRWVSRPIATSIVVQDGGVNKNRQQKWRYDQEQS